MVAMTSPAGFDARAIETGDAEVWAGLLAAKERVDQEGVSFSPADLIDELNDPHLNAALDTVGVWAGRQMVAYATVHAADSVIDVDRVRSEGAVHPQWRRRGLGTALMPWLIERAATPAGTRVSRARSATARSAPTSEPTGCCTGSPSSHAGTSST